MGNDLTNVNNTAVGAAIDPFAAAAEGLGGGNATYVSFNGNDGNYLFGPKDDKDEIPLGTKLAFDMQNAIHGWVCWVDGEPVEQIEQLIASGEPLPKEEELEDHGPYNSYEDGSEDGWVRLFAIPWFSLADGSEFLFKISSGSGLRAVGQLLKDFSRQYRMKPGKLPVVEIGSKSFEIFAKDKVTGAKTKKSLGFKHAPTFKIVDWVDAGVVATATADGSEDESNYVDEPAAIETPAAPPPPPAPAPEPAPAARPARARATPAAPAPAAPAATAEAPPAAAPAASPEKKRARAF